MKTVRNLFVVFAIIGITYGIMINVNRNKENDYCTTVYVVRDEDEDHILNNSDYMEIKGKSISEYKDIYNSETFSKDLFQLSARSSERQSEEGRDIYNLTKEQQSIVKKYKKKFEKNLTQEEKKERYNQFLNDFITASPMYTFSTGTDGIKRMRQLS
tara:strand:- start:2604 stop:3074 length:471 start_codon:yes stop_codon:yes gene_type:complete